MIMAITSGSSRGGSLFPSGRGYGYGMIQRRQRELSHSETSEADESVQNQKQHSPPEPMPGESLPPSADPGQSHSIETAGNTGEENSPSGYARPDDDKHAGNAGLEPSNSEVAAEATAYVPQAVERSSSHGARQDFGFTPLEGHVPITPAIGQAGPDHHGTDTHQTGTPGDEDTSKKTRVTLGTAIQAQISQAILDGTIEDFIDKIRGFIQSLSRLLETTDSGAEILGNLVRRVREELEREIQIEAQATEDGAGGEDTTGLGSGPETGGTPGFRGSRAVGFDPAMFRLMWSLLKTPEFQQFTSKMIAQTLKGGLPAVQKGRYAPKPA